LAVLLQAEDEYHIAVKGAVKEAEKYSDDRKSDQAAYIEQLKRDWHAFEQAENERLERELLAQEKNMEAEAAELRARMKLRQQEKADEISERLKEEVLSLLWQ